MGWNVASSPVNDIDQQRACAIGDASLLLGSHEVVDCSVCSGEGGEVLQVLAQTRLLINCQDHGMIGAKMSDFNTVTKVTQRDERIVAPSSKKLKLEARVAISEKSQDAELVKDRNAPFLLFVGHCAEVNLDPHPFHGT